MAVARFHARPRPVVLGLDLPTVGNEGNFWGWALNRWPSGACDGWINTRSLGMVNSFYQTLRGCKTRKRIRKMYC